MLCCNSKYTHPQPKPATVVAGSWSLCGQAASEYLSVLGMWEEFPTFPSITPTATHLHAQHIFGLWVYRWFIHMTICQTRNIIYINVGCCRSSLGPQVPHYITVTIGHNSPITAEKWEGSWKDLNNKKWINNRLIKADVAYKKLNESSDFYYRRNPNRFKLQRRTSVSTCWQGESQHIWLKIPLFWLTKTARQAFI